MDSKAFKLVILQVLAGFAIISCKTIPVPSQQAQKCELYPLKIPAIVEKPVAFHPTSHASARNFWTNPYSKWPQGRIPFIISEAYSAADRDMILSAISEWETKTCVLFISRTAEDIDYVKITPDDGTESYCYSYVGRIGGQQLMKMFGECLRSAAMIHELGHAIGFNHEHQRPDRDDFVNIYLENVDPPFHYAFDKFSWEEVTTLGISYDYSSVMQYPFHAFTGAHDPS